MAHPIVFVSHFAIKAGMLNRLKRLAEEVTAQLDAEKPQTSVYLGYVDENGTEMTFVHLFLDSHAMDLHFEGAQERSSTAYELMDPLGWEIYGEPSDAGLGMLRQAALSAGVPLTFQPAYVAGFVRLPSAPTATPS